MLIMAVTLALVAAVIDYFFKIGEPWRKIVMVGIVVVFVIGLLQLALTLRIP